MALFCKNIAISFRNTGLTPWLLGNSCVVDIERSQASLVLQEQQVFLITESSLQPSRAIFRFVKDVGAVYIYSQ